MKKSNFKILRLIFFYFPFLFMEMIKSGLGVAKVILTGKVLSPGLARVKKLRTNNANVLYANSITLTPGTFTIEIDDEHLIIHSLIDSGEDNKFLKNKVEELLC